MTTEDPLLDIALSAREGDDRSIELLIRSTQPVVWRVCTALGSPGEVEDLVSETYLRALRGLGSFRAESSVSTWLIAIARNVCADQVRSRARQRRLHERLRSQRGSVVEHPPDHTDGLLAMIDSDRREAFVLTQVLGLSYEETAMIIGVPIGTVRSRVARARTDLRAAVAQAEAN